MANVTAQQREKVIARTSVISIIANVALAAVKAAVGLAVNSIAVILDAVNNLSDALSSIITVVGAKLAGRKPDKKHPLGHGRIEYLSAMIVAGLILYAGITSLVESIKKIIHPEPADYSTLSLILISVAIVVKLILGLYVKKKGNSVGSAALAASGKDALFDAVISLSVLASAIIFLTAGVSLEAWAGVIISVIIIKSGVEMMIETLNDIIGHRTEAELTAAIKSTIAEDPQVLGAYDLFLYNYGPDKYYGSVHVEVDCSLTASEIDTLDRRVQQTVYEKHGIILTGISIYAVDNGSDETALMRKTVIEKVMAHDYTLQVHGFYVDPAEKRMTFDAVLSFDCDRDAALRELHDEISALYPGYRIHIQPDIDVTE
ncbi:MAG: cation diffusion facilitator family transporter [Clostridiales bacterium]|nr:cation diffusion facilitator family transporter [Clostridiales bacterium]